MRSVIGELEAKTASKAQKNFGGDVLNFVVLFEKSAIHNYVNAILTVNHTVNSWAMCQFDDKFMLRQQLFCREIESRRHFFPKTEDF